MLRRRLEVKKQGFRQLGEEDGHEKNEGKEGEGQAGAPRRLHHAQGDPGGASCPAKSGANITVLATRASSSESKEVWFGYQRYRR